MYTVDFRIPYCPTVADLLWTNVKQAIEADVPGAKHWFDINGDSTVGEENKSYDAKNYTYQEWRKTTDNPELVPETLKEYEDEQWLKDNYDSLYSEEDEYPLQVSGTHQLCEEFGLDAEEMGWDQEDQLYQD